MKMTEINYEALIKELGLEDFEDEVIEELDLDIEILHLLEEAEEVVEDEDK